MNRDRLDTLSIPNYVTKTGPHRGVRHGNTDRQRICHVAHVAATKAGKEGCLSILDQFQRCAFYRESQIAIGWDEAFCAKYIRISKEDHTYMFFTAGHRMKLRKDYAKAINILTEKEFYKKPQNTHKQLHPNKQVRQRANQPFSRSSEGTERVDPRNWMEMVSFNHLKLPIIVAIN